MTKNIERTLNFLRSEFENCDYFMSRPDEREYRIRHSIRVANIGAEIAKKENMNVEAMTIACLLHDIGYKHEFTSHEDSRNHGRVGAGIAREFLKELDLEEHLKSDICYGIAIHVDDVADFEGRRNAFTETVSDSDNIDRFDVYRIYDNLRHSNFNGLAHEKQLEYVNRKLTRLEELKAMKFGTETATALWLDRLDYQIDFHGKLNEQLENGERVK